MKHQYNSSHCQKERTKEEGSKAPYYIAKPVFAVIKRVGYPADWYLNITSLKIAQLITVILKRLNIWFFFFFSGEWSSGLSSPVLIRSFSELGFWVNSENISSRFWLIS